jgi:hypothetical protein
MKEDSMNENSMNKNIAGENALRWDCARFQEILHELDRPGASEAAWRESALAHAEGCSHCGALLTEAEALDFALARIADGSSEAQASPKVEAALLREFRRERVRVSSRRVQWQLAILGAAAVVLFLLSFMMRRPQVVAPVAGNAASVSQSIAHQPSALAVESPALSSASVNRSAQPKDARAISNPASKTVNSAGSGEAATEYATAYIPLPYAYDPSGLEGGSVVRVVLPRAALASYGLPLDGMGIGEQVTADMVVSEDGTPQAIRLLAQANTSSEF